MAKKQKLLRLRDTAGHFYMNIKLPSANYKPKKTPLSQKKDRPPLTKEEKNRARSKRS